MVTRRNRATPAAFGATALLLGGCAWLPSWQHREQADAAPEIVEAPEFCDFAVTKANAWVNRMPTTETSRPPQLVVSIGLSDRDAVVQLARSAASAEGILVLDVEPSERRLVPGHAGYREPVSDPPIERVELRCEGRTVATIDRVETVY